MNRELLLMVKGAAERKAWEPLHDWLCERNRDKEAAEVSRLGQRECFDEIVGMFALPELHDYDWCQAFGYAGEAETHAGGGNVPERALPNDDISVDPISRIDVKRIIAKSEGEHDEQNWLIVGELWDGRFFSLSAGCDYTGWD